MADEYSYEEVVRSDILDYAVSDGYNPKLLDAVNEDDRDTLYQILYDVCWDSDSITGNSSGSYTCDSGEAKKYIFDDSDASYYLEEAVKNYDIPSDCLAEHFLDWEWIDCTIRLYLVSQVLNDIIYGKSAKDKADYEKLVASIREEYGEDNE